VIKVSGLLPGERERVIVKTAPMGRRCCRDGDVALTFAAGAKQSQGSHRQTEEGMSIGEYYLQPYNGESIC